jgi:release factor glutamine methyltransferase
VATVAEALRGAERTLAAAGVETAARDAELLLRHVAGWDVPGVIFRMQEPLEPPLSGLFHTIVAARAQRRPLQHLTGHQAFWRHEFKVTPDVLIPRPETELLVEAALACLKGVTEPIIVDVGTGSGCIAVSLAAERPDAHVIGIDISPAALEVAAENASTAAVRRVEWLQGDLLAPVARRGGAIDLVAANPPYVDVSERESLAPEVRDHEPAAALFPRDGDRYSVYRRLVPEARTVLRPGGWLLLEVGAGMADEVARLCGAAALEVDRVIADLQSIPRTVVARRP